MLLVALDLVFTGEIYRDKNADDPFCCFFFFLPFLSGVKKKKKETEDKIRKITYESAKRDDSIRNIGRG